MQTFFVNFAQKISVGDVILLNDPDDCFHIARSLRMAAGEKIKVSNGNSQYVCRLNSIHDRECEATVEEELGSMGEPPYRALVFQGLPKGDKLETVIRKSTELGAAAVIPFVSDFCTVKPKDAAGEAKKRQRRQSIAKEAAKQCGRTLVPEVGGVLTFKEMLSEARKSDVTLFCYESEDRRTLKNAVRECDLVGKTVSVIIGSEGGFSHKEASLLIESGALSLSLGNRILRTETASSYVLSVLSCTYEL